MVVAGDGKYRSNKRKTTHQLSKRVTYDQFSDFEDRAEEAGFPDYQSYLTAFILGKVEIDTAQKRDIVRSLGHLGKIGSNLNQIAAAVNSGKLNSLEPDQIKTIDEILDAIEELGEEIREALK